MSVGRSWRRGHVGEQLPVGRVVLGQVVEGLVVEDLPAEDLGHLRV